MHVIETVREMRECRRGLQGRVGLVATLGGMHAGHEAHLVRSREISDVTVGSLFLNPTQFAAGEDLATYPHDREHDLGVFERHGASIVFAPSSDEMYPPGDNTRVDPGRIATILEGAHRPGHFVGVATVVTKLLSIIRPDVAMFGEKDAQQLRIIQRLNRDLMLGVQIEPIPTVREADGLALSSRNRYLDENQRAAAPQVYAALVSGRDLWLSGERDADALRNHVSALLQKEPLFDVEYVSLADSGTLEELHGQSAGPCLLSLAVRVGLARLIDNVLLD